MIAKMTKQKIIKVSTKNKNYTNSTTVCPVGKVNLN